MSKINPLQSGLFYKVKNPQRKFLCALCSAQREIKYSKNLSYKNYMQIIVLSITASWLLFSFMGPKSVFAIFLIWPVFEVVNKLLYRKEISCPYCGFDATWYRRDVNVANKKVKDFWKENYPDLVNKPELDIEDETASKASQIAAEYNEAQSQI
jgi:hypothetical protein